MRRLIATVRCGENMVISIARTVRFAEEGAAKAQNPAAMGPRAAAIALRSVAIGLRTLVLKTFRDEGPHAGCTARTGKIVDSA